MSVQPEKRPNKIPPTISHITVSPETAAKLRTLASQLDVDHAIDPVGFVTKAHCLSRQIPKDLVEALYEFECGGGGVLVIHGLPVGFVPPTPAVAVNALTGKLLLTKVSSIIASALGHLVGYRSESNGAVVQALVPVRAEEILQVSTSSKVILKAHVEQCFNLKTRPDFILLGTHRGDPSAATCGMSNRTVQDLLPSRTIRLLHDPVFFSRVDPSFVRGGINDEPRGPMPVLAGSPDDPQVNYDRDSMFTDSPAHAAALDAVGELWDALKAQVVLAAGDLLIIDQSRAIHGRSSFVPRYDGSDRWVTRLQVRKDHAQSRFARDGSSPVIEPRGY